MRREELTSFDGKRISLAVWDEVPQPKGVVQIAHGMSEHIARYDEFARFLNSRGYIAVGDDHRAHGLTDPDALGISPEGGDLFEDTVRDLIEIGKLLKRYGLPAVLFGHSYGSFLVQRYLTLDTSLIGAAVLSGSALQVGAAVSFGARLSSRKCRRGKSALPGKLIAHLTFGSYDKRFREGINAWLSRDEVEVGKYNIDPLCGFVCSYGFYRDFFAGLKRVAASPITLDKSKPVMIISGADDMVGGRGRLVTRLKDKFVSTGYGVAFKLYAGARHELVNEVSKAEVYRDVAAFMDGAVVNEG